MKKCCKKWIEPGVMGIRRSDKVINFFNKINFCPECGLSLIGCWCCCGGKGTQEDPFKDGILKRYTICDRCIKPIKSIELPEKFHEETIEALSGGELIGDIAIHQSVAKINDLIGYLKSKEN